MNEPMYLIPTVTTNELAELKVALRKNIESLVQSVQMIPDNEAYISYLATAQGVLAKLDNAYAA
jgi:heme oxygenase